MATNIITRDPDPIDEAGIESFPASDPPSWTPLRTGLPARKDSTPENSIPLDSEDWQSVQAENLHAAKRVVGLLLAISFLGLVMYLSIFFWILMSIR